MLLRKWSQKNNITPSEAQPVTKFINSVEAMQKTRNDSSLNSLIAHIKENNKVLIDLKDF